MESPTSINLTPVKSHEGRLMRGRVYYIRDTELSVIFIEKFATNWL